MLPGPCRKISLLAVSLLFPFGYTSSFSSLRFLPFFPVHLFASLSWVLHMQLRNFVHFRFTCNTGIGKIRFRKYLSSRMSHGPLVSLCVCIPYRDFLLTFTYLGFRFHFIWRFLQFAVTWAYSGESLLRFGTLSNLSSAQHHSFYSTTSPKWNGR